MRREHQYFKGVTYYRYPDSPREADRRYFKRQGKLIHRVIWEDANGPIPPGFHIHHKDGDPGNNDIDNLQAVEVLEHLSGHTLGRVTDGMRANLERIRPLASEWHRTEQGRAWHSEHAKQAFARRQPLARTCDRCGKAFESMARRESDRFCSNACKAAWRRESGVDDIDVVCAGCGATFRRNKYVKRKYCGPDCPGR